MRRILELKRNLSNREYYLDQFQYKGERNIIYVSPPLSGRYLYRAILPSILLPEISNGAIATAITNLQEYSLIDQLLGYKPFELFSPTNKSDEQTLIIKWATEIRFPMTIQPLSEVYSHIRSINPDCRLIFNVDFNYYLLPEKHPCYSLFSDEHVIDLIESNLYHSDVIIVTNHKMKSFLIHKMQELVKTKYRGVYRDSVSEEITITIEEIKTLDTIVLENVDYSPSDIIFKVPNANPVKDVNNKKHIKTHNNRVYKKKAIKKSTPKRVSKTQSSKTVIKNGKTKGQTGKK